MLAGEPLIVVGPVHTDVTVDHAAEAFADGREDLFVTTRTHQSVREVGVHARAVPVELSEGLGMPLDGVAILLADPLEQVAGHPDLVTGLLGTLGEDLKFPLAGCDLGVDAFDIQPGFEAGIQMLLDAGPPMGVFGAHRAIVGTLGRREASRRKARRVVVLRAPEEVFLFEAEPEVFVVFIDRGPAVRLVWRAVSIEYLGHHEVGILAAGIGVDGDRLEQTVGVAAGGLLRA